MMLCSLTVEIHREGEVTKPRVVVHGAPTAKQILLASVVLASAITNSPGLDVDPEIFNACQGWEAIVQDLLGASQGPMQITNSTPLPGTP